MEICSVRHSIYMYICHTVPIGYGDLLSETINIHLYMLYNANRLWKSAQSDTQYTCIYVIQEQQGLGGGDLLSQIVCMYGPHGI